MIKAGKIWGQTELINADGGNELHRIEFKKGFKCSEHKHEFKWNAFYVETGKLLLRVWQDDEYKLIDSTWLSAGDLSIVPAGEYHQFHAHQETEALEIYWTELSHNDIIRENVGGI